MLDQNFVFVGVLIGAIGSASYIIDTVKGKIQPNKISFGLWAVAPLIAFFAELNQHVGIQSLLTLSVGVFPLLIFLASFMNKKAYWKISTFDLVCGLLSLVGLLLWYLTKVGNWAIFFSILADAFACVPTITKAYRFPETESALPWLADSSNGLFTLLTIQNWNFATASYPFYIFIANIVIFATVQFRWGKRIKRHK